MKTLFIITLTLLTAAASQAQTADSSARRGGTPGSGKANHVRTDRFIDADGDGICDQRAQGLGFQRHGKMKWIQQQNTANGEHPATQQGKGKRKGSAK
jgi:hypothetical protein